MNLQVGYADRAAVGLSWAPHLLWLLHAGLDWGDSVLLCGLSSSRRLAGHVFMVREVVQKCKPACSMFPNLCSSPLGSHNKLPD